MTSEEMMCTYVSGGRRIVLLGGNAGLRLVSMVMLLLADFRRGKSLVSRQEAIAAESSSSTVTKESEEFTQSYLGHLKG